MPLTWAFGRPLTRLVFCKNWKYLSEDTRTPLKGWYPGRCTPATPFSYAVLIFNCQRVSCSSAFRFWCSLELDGGNLRPPGWEGMAMRYTAVVGPATRPAAWENAALLAAAGLDSPAPPSQQEIIQTCLSTRPSQTRALAAARNICTHFSLSLSLSLAFLS